MQALAKRRLCAVFTEKKIEIVVKIFRVAGAGANDEHRPHRAFCGQRQQIAARAALNALNSFRAAPISFEELSDSLSQRDVTHEKKLNR